MDFALTEDQLAVAELATKIFTGRLTAEHRKALDGGGDPFDAGLWTLLADAGLLGVALADDVGGAGHGLLGQCALLSAAGAAAAPVPLWSVLSAAAAVDRFGSAAQRQAVLPALVAGTAMVTLAITEPGLADPQAPTTTARRDGAGWRLAGVKTCVPAAQRATHLLVPARGDGGEALVFLVDPGAAGVSIERQVATTGELQGLVTLRDVPVGADARLDGDVLPWLVERAEVGLCALELGIVERVLRMTAEYTTTRIQFDRPIATFQAVAQRAADAYIDVESIRLTLQEAAWRLHEGLAATREVAIAKFFAAEAGQRVTYAAQHLHGGIGFDLEYPLARYYPLSKQIELALGGANAQLARLGALLAA